MQGAGVATDASASLAARSDHAGEEELANRDEQWHRRGGPSEQSTWMLGMDAHDAAPVARLFQENYFQVLFPPSHF